MGNITVIYPFEADSLLEFWPLDPEQLAEIQRTLPRPSCEKSSEAAVR